MIHSGNFGIALLLTLLAGASTGIGSAIAYFIRKPKPTFLSFSLGLSAGVMIYTSFVELLPTALKTIGLINAQLLFFVGIIFIGLIDMLVPKVENPHHYTMFEDSPTASTNQLLMRTGLLAALAVGIHNFPEGLATFITTYSSVKLGFFIAMAIAIHNIPEGIAVSVPIFYATGNRNKAFSYSFLSGLSEPVGAIIGYFVFRPFLSQSFVAYLLAFVAGIMVYISLDELVPAAHQYGQNHLVILGIVLGMLIMATSLVLL